ncbi:MULTISPECIES: type I restriction endonuclease [Actinoalloteichus]|uniref:Restriction endonuclease type I HsdR N-terminal domain-containing protein n=1 Tax=Actinoalloteichus fjordicus TaxID=1612552 RepID=A0AAC9PSK4_9PSEU|nr:MULTISPECIES: type I restriction endonuclease [Actinoalloteichus]APU14931.1 hypothetical protein UA74_14365 [Actinoalloteichus fjordicus]APU21001.1 hypothetical protein UA75_14955 [Actinoalloteichus sp. GBA129-24]
MDIAERTQELALKVHQHKGSVETEEATKNAFVMPFISSVLGYDVFNPAEVIPEFTVDVGMKKGEKVDYAIVHDGEVQVLVEAKKVNDPLRIEHASQLFRYFAVTNARIAILTNGETYHFYTDLDAPNRMDDKPFLIFDLTDIDETLLPELAKLTKESFDLDSVINAAGELKYVGRIKRVLAAQFTEPDDEWVRFLTTRVYERSFTQRVRDQFLPLVDKAMRQFLTEQVNDRLKTALGSSGGYVSGRVAPFDDMGAADLGGPTITDSGEAPADVDEEAGEARRGILTTEEELEGFRIVRAIVCSEVQAARITARDTKTYFGVLLDDNNRRPIARLWFNRSQKYLGVFDAAKNETRIPITHAEEIYQHADQLRATVARYLTGSNGAAGSSAG